MECNFGLKSYAWFETTRFEIKNMISDLAPVVQTWDSAIHQINDSPVDKYLGNQLRYPLDRFLSSG